MKADLLEKLLDAGFTKDEIIQLARDEPVALSPDVDISKPDDNVPEDSSNVNPESPANPDPLPEDPKPAEPEPKLADAVDQRLSGIEKSLTSLLKSIQLANLRGDSFGDQGISIDDQAEAIMKSIIRPENERSDEK